MDDVDRAAEFYSALFEQVGMRISPGRHYFDVGGVVLALYSPRADGDATEPRANFEHVYVAVDDLEAVYGRAKRIGGLSARTGDGNLPMGEIARRPWGERSFYMRATRSAIRSVSSTRPRCSRDIRDALLQRDCTSCVFERAAAAASVGTVAWPLRRCESAPVAGPRSDAAPDRLTLGPTRSPCPSHQSRRGRSKLRPYTTCRFHIM